MVTAKFNFLVLVALTVYTTLVKKSSIRNSSVKHTYFLANSTKKNALLWRGIVWKDPFRKLFTFYAIALDNPPESHSFSYFFGSLRREKYYKVLLKMKAAFRVRSPRRRKLDLRNVPKIYRPFIRQLHFIWRCGVSYRIYRNTLRTPFSNFFISYDNLYLRRFRTAILRLQKKKFYLSKSLRYKKKRVRPWKFYNLKRIKIKARRRIVHFGSLRLKRFLRNSGTLHFQSRYSYLIRRWQNLLQRSQQLALKRFWRYPVNDYFSLVTTNFLHDFRFYNYIFYVFFKKKKNNIYLTLTNGFGEVLVNLSSGRFLKFRRNKKLRASLLNLPGLITVFVKKVVRKKITLITKLFRPAGMSKRAMKTIYNIFNGSGVVIKTLVKNTKRSHGLLKKTKKARRL